MAARSLRNRFYLLRGMRMRRLKKLVAVALTLQPTVAWAGEASYGTLPLHFERNRGQAHEEVEFLARGSGYELYLTANESVLVLRRPNAAASVVRMRLVGANPRPVVEGGVELPGKSHYFVGRDPRRWRTNVPQFARVELKDIYPGISLTYYGAQGQLEYDFVVDPGADPGRIRWTIEGADEVRVDADGGLRMCLPGGELVQRAPVVYQEVGLTRKPIRGRFVLKGPAEVGFDVGPYDADRALVLDPVLVYSTYLGGNHNDTGYGITVDTSGNAYVTGSTISINFPTANPLQAENAGMGDAFVAKLNAAGSALVYSTYLGGGDIDSGTRIAVDTSGNAYVTGLTRSTDFPTASPLQVENGGSNDAFIAKLNATGSALVYSTYLGGSGHDSGSGVAVDTTGNAYVMGSTQSADFPTANALQAALGGPVDAFVAKLDAAGAGLVYSTYLGGSSGEHGGGLAVDASGNAYVTGQTDSSDFPIANPLQAESGGTGDAFVTKLNAAGSALVYSTYLGGSNMESGNGIAVNASGNAYVTGVTFSADFPTANPLQAANAGGFLDAFVAKLNDVGSGFIYSTYLGGSGEDGAGSIVVDRSGNAYVTGDTNSVDFPTSHPLQATNAGGYDAFVAKLNAAGESLVYSTYLGGASSDGGTGIAVDPSGNAFATGQTFSTNFPTAHPFQATSAGFSDAFVARIGSRPPGDFNGDVKADILWRNAATGGNTVWFMNGTMIAGSAILIPVSDVNWRIVGTADFSGDGKSDILWRNATTGAIFVWVMNGPFVTGTVQVAGASGSSWQIVATADFNGDGKPDILWRNATTGTVAVWFMDGTAVSGSALVAAATPSSWQIVGAADFNADGRPDVLWRNAATGANAVWFMSGVMVVGAAVLPSVIDPNWQIAGTADLSYDGRPDILWRHVATGANAVWFMNGTTVAGSAALPPAGDTNWRIVGPR